MSRPAGTLERLERILTMVPWLLEHPGAAVEEVCRRFSVTRDELAADLDILGYCGLPGYGGGDLVEASIVGDRVLVRMADFFRRPLRLSLREALTLLLAARTMTGVAGLPESAALRRAEATLTQLIGAAAGETGQADPAITVDLRAPGDEHLAALRGAVDGRQVVRLTYRSGSRAEITERDVEPWSLTGSLGSWYLQGYCRLARAPRAFRLDRIRDLELTDEVADGAEPPHGAATPLYQPGPDDERVVLDLGPDAWWVTEWAVVEEVSEHEQVRRVTLRSGSREWITRLVLSLGGGATVVEPADLQRAVAARARTVLERYRATALKVRPAGTEIPGDRTHPQGSDPEGRGA